MQVMGGDIVVADSKWHHVAGVCNKNAGQLYVDGILRGETQIGAPPDTNSSPLTIFVLLSQKSSVWVRESKTTFDGSVINTYQGLIDEVGLFNKALTEDDIKNIMTNGLEKAIGIIAVSPKDKLTQTWGTIKIHLMSMEISYCQGSQALILP